METSWLLDKKKKKMEISVNYTLGASFLDKV